jgi:signal transduction histidine kinase
MRPERRFFATRWLIALSILLPWIIFALAAWQNRASVLTEAETRVEKSVRTLLEHSLKVFETHRLTIDRINERLRTLNWNDDAERLSLHRMLKQLQDDLDQIATITITDSEGRLRASSRIHPINPEISFADRDWFSALRERPLSRLFVGQTYVGRQSGQAVFNVADRVAAAADVFDGAIAISVDRAYFERYYSSIESLLDHNVFLVRADGVVLARVPRTDVQRLPESAPLLARIRRGERNGLYVSVSQVDGVERIIGFAAVDPYPVIVGFGVSKASVLAVWWRNVLSYGALAAFSSLALLWLSWIVARQFRSEREISERLEVALGQLRSEMVQRAEVEEKFRQSQKMDALGRLTGGIAHDFNNLLTVIMGSMDLLRKRLTQNDPSVRRLVDHTSDAAQRAATLTQRLLAFSRQQPLEPKVVDANKLVSGMSDLLYRTLGENIEIETVLGAGLWRASVDPHELEHAILNLAVNARDAMPDGGRLTIETANANLDAAYAERQRDVKPGQYIMIAVSDTGTGMSPDVAARAFDPFFTTKAAGKGTGLGLSQVYGFVKQSGGHASIYSETGHGTVLKLYLPRTAAPETASLPAAPAVEPAAHFADAKILVVEDDAAVRAFSAQVLTEAGFRVVQAADGDEGLRALAEHPDLQLLFTDVVLTGSMNGRGLANEAEKLRPELPVLFTTGYTANAIVHHGRLDEGVNLIGKPFSATALLTKVNEVLTGKR